MKGDLGTILYVVFLILFSVAGIFNKKKKVEAEERKKKLLQQQAAALAAEEAETDTARQIPEEEPVSTTGNPLVDALLNTSEEKFSSGDETIKGNAYYDETLEVPEKEEEPEEFLPYGEEGKSVFSRQQPEKTAPVDKNRIVADQPDWQKFMDEQNKVEGPEIMEDFDPVKAVIYSEIMERKYF
jgi:hypothetical protein